MGIIYDLARLSQRINIREARLTTSELVRLAEHERASAENFRNPAKKEIA